MKKYLCAAIALAITPLHAGAQTVFCFIDGQVYSGEDCRRDQTAPEPDPIPEDEPVDEGTGDMTLDPVWTLLSGRNLVDVDVGANGEIFGLAGRPSNGTYPMFQYNGTSWQQHPGRVREIEVRPNGTVLAAGVSGRYLEFVGERWRLLDTGVNDIGLDERGTPFAALVDGSIVTPIDGQWQQIAQGDKVEAGPGGLVAFQSGDGPIQVISPFGNFILPGEVGDFSVGADGHIYAVLSEGASGMNEAVLWAFPFGWQTLGAVDVRGLTAAADGTIYAWFEDGSFMSRPAPNP